MKRRDLEKRLRESGCWLVRHGGSHDVWSNGAKEFSIPRHNEIDERLAKSIIRQAEG